MKVCSSLFRKGLNSQPLPSQSKAGIELLKIVGFMLGSLLLFVFPKMSGFNAMPRFMQEWGTTRLFAKVLTNKCFWSLLSGLLRFHSCHMTDGRQQKEIKMLGKQWHSYTAINGMASAKQSMTLTVARYRAARGQDVFRYSTILTTGPSHGRRRMFI